MYSTYTLLDVAQSMVEERNERAQRNHEYREAVLHERARQRFQRSIQHGLRNGLADAELAAQLWQVLRRKHQN